jgi:retinol dehydrogenase-12
VLLEKNAKVYIATRNKSRAEAAIAEMKQATGYEAHFLECDLADLASVRRAAATFMR